MLPKSYAVRNANKMALIVAPVVNIFVKIFAPVVWLLQIIAYYTFKLFGLNKDNSSAADSLAEVRGAIYMYDGKEAQQEKAMLKSILDLTDVEVYDVMNHRKNLFSLDIDLPVEEILNRVKTCPFSRIPLYKDRPENIVGVIRVKTLFKEAVEHHGNYQDIKIEELMTKPWFIPENTTLMQQLQLFRARREHFAIVVDEYGGLQGIVTLEDILEEIVGDISDEYDEEEKNYTKIDENTYIFEGKILLNDFYKITGLDENEFGDKAEDAETLAGLILDIKEDFPKIKEQIDYGRFQFIVLELDKRRIGKVKVIINSPSEE